MVASSGRSKAIAHHVNMVHPAGQQLLADVIGSQSGQGAAQRMPCNQQTATALQAITKAGCETTALRAPRKESSPRGSALCSTHYHEHTANTVTKDIARANVLPTRCAGSSGFARLVLHRHCSVPAADIGTSTQPARRPTNGDRGHDWKQAHSESLHSSFAANLTNEG